MGTNVEVFLEQEKQLKHYDLVFHKQAFSSVCTNGVCSESSLYWQRRHFCASLHLDCHHC